MKIQLKYIYSIITIWLLSLTFATTSTFAQSGNILSGRVSDPNNTGIAGANVTIIERDNRTRFSTTTDEQGIYRFERLASGEYALEIEANGFAQSTKILRVTSENTQTLDVELGIAAVAAEVIVTASGTAQSVDEVSKAITVIGSEEIERRDEITIAESLRRTPGLRVREINGPGSQTTITTRGLRNEDTAILIDGLRFRDAGTTQGDASSFLSDLLVVNTDRIEVLRGSGSSLYGTNAIGGVVNILTDQGGGKTRGEFQAEGGGLGLFRGRTKISGGAFADRFRYSAGIAHLNVSKGVDGNNAARNTSGQGFVAFNFTPSISITGRIFAGDAFTQLNSSPFAATGFTLPALGVSVRAVPLELGEQRRVESVGRPLTATNYVRGDANFIPALDDPDSRRSGRFFSGAITFNQRLNDDLSYRVSYQRLTTNRIFNDGTGGLRFAPTFANSTDIKGRTNTLNARVDWQINRFNFISGGYEFEDENYNSLALDENPNAALRTNNFITVTQRSSSFFIQDQIRLFSDRLQISGAFRAQSFSLKRPEFRGGVSVFDTFQLTKPPTAYTGDGSISYFFRSTNTKLRGHVGNGYRAPALFERFGSSFSGGTFTPFGDPRLSPDRSIAFDAGFDQNFLNGKIRASATYFYTKLQEIVVFGNSTDIPPATDPLKRTSGGYFNTGGGLARGGEFSVSTQLTRDTDVTVSYTRTNADQRRPPVTGFIRTLGISDHLFTVFANQRIGKRIDVTFDLFAASSYAISFSNR
ncbi:MAG: TonB-dependent receptor, partial [Pyrinomonadaceae bacterium]|nr:TonB-dependent receptor [Pyrinomonadaceae bacterium]